MQAKAINPYTFLGQQHKDALDFIIANLPPNPTFDNLNEVLRGALFPDFSEYPKVNDVLGPYAGTILPNAYNGYVNGMASGKWQVASGNTGEERSERRIVISNTEYNEKQQVIITSLIEGIKRVPAESIEDFLSAEEENIASANLSYEEQTPLFIAAAIGKSDAAYWGALIENPGVWVTYLSDNATFNYLHMADTVSASVQGALLTYGLIKPPQIQLLDVYTSLIGATGLAAGKVVFGWYP